MPIVIKQEPKTQEYSNKRTKFPVEDAQESKRVDDEFSAWDRSWQEDSPEHSRRQDTSSEQSWTEEQESNSPQGFKDHSKKTMQFFTQNANKELSPVERPKENPSYSEREVGRRLLRPSREERAKRARPHEEKSHKPSNPRKNEHPAHGGIKKVYELPEVRKELGAFFEEYSALQMLPESNTFKRAMDKMILDILKDDTLPIAEIKL